MKKLFIILISFSALLFSCSKNKMDTGKVQVRIKNVTGFTLENAAVGNINYGDVTTDQLTDYKILDQPIYAGYCTFTANGVPSVAGFGMCGTPLPPPFEPGYYTFEVTPSGNGYNAVNVIKK